MISNDYHQNPLLALTIFYNKSDVLYINEFDHYSRCIVLSHARN